MGQEHLAIKTIALRNVNYRLPDCIYISSVKVLASNDQNARIRVNDRNTCGIKKAERNVKGKKETNIPGNEMIKKYRSK
jgi:hypothetical protein